MPFSVPASLAAPYLALHSFMVSPLAGSALAASDAAGFLAAGAAFVAALASALHSALRNWFHVMPFSVPASLAAPYLALHSAIVRALAGAAANRMTARPERAASRLKSIIVLHCNCTSSAQPIARNGRFHQPLRV